MARDIEQIAKIGIDHGFRLHERLSPLHSKQLLTYLRLTGRQLGLLMNFGSAMFRDGVKRLINSGSEYVAPIVKAGANG